MAYYNSIFVLAILIDLMLCSVAMADPPPGKGNPNHSSHGRGGQEYGAPQGNSANYGVNLVGAGITSYAARDIALSSGFIGYKPLPPGVLKNLARGKPLPPGIAKQHVPGSMLGRLPQYPGYEWRVAGTDLVLVAIQTAIVVDVLSGVFR